MEGEEGAHPLRFLSSKFESEPVVYFQEKLLSALFDKLLGHRRRIKKEEKAKVIAAVMGDGIHSIPCRTTDLSPG